MKLLWVAIAQFQKGEGPLGLTSPMASMRYRILIPAAELIKKKHQVALATVVEGFIPPGLRENLNFDALIFSKVMDETGIALAKAARERGVKIIFDICDNHFDNPDFAYSPYYHRMAELADI